MSIDASTADEPSMTTPSVAIFSPGLTTNRSPTWTSSIGTSRSVPSTSSTDALFAPMSRRACNADPARCFAFASASRPASTNTTTTAATSKYT